MARVKPFRRLEIDAQICAKITKIMEQERYRGSFTSKVETVLDLYGDGLLKDIRETVVEPARVEAEHLHAVRGGRRVGSARAKSA